METNKINLEATLKTDIKALLPVLIFLLTIVATLIAITSINNSAFKQLDRLNAETSILLKK